MQNKGSVTQRDMLLINKWLDDEISQEQEQELFERLATCKALQEKWYLYQVIKAKFSGEPLVPEDFAQQCLNSKEAEDQESATILQQKGALPNSKSA